MKHNVKSVRTLENHWNGYGYPSKQSAYQVFLLTFIPASFAGVKPRQWSEEASIVFRNHVEKKPLVAQLEAVQEATNPWDRKLTVFLVDTSQEERDIWVHDIMAEFADELTNEL